MKLNKIAAALTCAAIAVAGATITSTAVAGPHDKMMHKAELGHAAPDFTLNDFDGNAHTLSDYTEDGKIVVLEWFNPACPYVVLHYEKQTTMNDLAAKYGKENVVFLAINSSNENHPGHTKTEEMIKEWGINHVVLNDADGKVGKMYGAKTTPHMYIVHKDGTLAYNGAIDNDRRGSKSGNEKVNYVANALDELIAGNKVSVSSTESYGCSVKYAKN